MKKLRADYEQQLRQFGGFAFDGPDVFQYRGKWREYFANRIGPEFDGRIVFEIGCANVMFLRVLAERNPRTAFVGLDWKIGSLCIGAQRIARDGQKNIALLHGRAQDIHKIFGGNEVDEIWVFHPDPCDKPAEKRNRLIAPPFLLDAHEVLRDDTSTLCLKTDHPGYFQHVIGLLDLPSPIWFEQARLGGHDATLPRVKTKEIVRSADIPKRSQGVLDRYEIAAVSNDFWNDPAAMDHTSSKLFAGNSTFFEERFLRKNLPIYYVELRKQNDLAFASICLTSMPPMPTIAGHMIQIPQRILMGPGPSDVPPRVLSALANPTIGHLDPVFLTLMDDIRTKLKTVFQTQNEMTLAMSGTGSAGMETLFANLVEQGDVALIGVNGVFGGRMVDVAQRCGATVEKLEAAWGTVFDQDAVIAAIRRIKPKIVALVHAETSTGALQPVDRIGKVAHEVGALLLLDCVTSLGGVPLKIDEWEVDAAYSGTQKCLSCPPGLSPVTFSTRAIERLSARKSKPQSWYLDLSMIKQYWGNERFYHHTAPINMLYGLQEALTIVLEEGLEKRFARHQEMHQLLKSGLAELGISYASQEGHSLPMLNAVNIPAGVEDAPVRKRLLEEYGIEIGAGLGVFKGKVWRIGLMGHAASRRNVALVLSALKTILGK